MSNGWKVVAEEMDNSESLGYSVDYKDSTIWFTIAAVDEEAAEKLVEILNSDEYYPPDICC